MEQTMIDKINAFAPIINAITVLLSFGFVIWTTCFRKTRRDKVDELKLEVLSVVCNTNGHEKWINAINTSHDPEYLSKVFDRKYHVKGWYYLLPVVLAELVSDGYHEFLGVSATTKIINQPVKINVGSPENQ